MLLWSLQIAAHACALSSSPPQLDLTGLIIFSSLFIRINSMAPQVKNTRRRNVLQRISLIFLHIVCRDHQQAIMPRAEPQGEDFSR